MHLRNETQKALRVEHMCLFMCVCVQVRICTCAMKPLTLHIKHMISCVCVCVCPTEFHICSSVLSLGQYSNWRCNAITFFIVIFFILHFHLILHLLIYLLVVDHSLRLGRLLFLAGHISLYKYETTFLDIPAMQSCVLVVEKKWTHSQKHSLFSKL